MCVFSEALRGVHVLLVLVLPVLRRCNDLSLRIGSEQSDGCLYFLKFRYKSMSSVHALLVCARVVATVNRLH